MPRITVGIRFRPDDADKKFDGFSFQEDTGFMELAVSGSKQEFTFDKLFTENSTQEDIFKQSTMSLVDEVLEGYNGCVFAYGQTGAGKTHTMSGPTNDERYEQRGLCMRVAGYLFERARKIPDMISLRISVLEVYNESLTDLLVEPVVNGPGSSTPVVPGSTMAPGALHSKLTIVDTLQGVIVPGLHILPISTYNDAYNILLEAQGNRAVAEHQLNRKSSRSHVIYTYYVTRTKLSQPNFDHNSSFRSITSASDQSDPDVTQSKLHLVDLAGSERMNKTGSTGTVAKEANHINKSLSYLEQVVIALTQNKRDHIPYRQSKLTYLLKDTLGGNCNTYLIACIWPHRNHSWETLSTLRFAARMKCIETHPVRNSLVSKEGGNAALVNSKYIQQIEALKKELAMRDFVHHNLTAHSNSSSASNSVAMQPDVWYPELSKQQRLKTYKQCYNLVKNTAAIADNSSGSNAVNTAVPHENDFSLADKNLDLQSLSHAYLLIGVLKTALEDVCSGCGQDAQKVISDTILSRNSGYADKLLEIFNSNSSGTSSGVAQSGENAISAAPYDESVDVPNTPTSRKSGKNSASHSASKHKNNKQPLSNISEHNEPTDSNNNDGNNDYNNNVEDGNNQQHSAEETAAAFEDFKVGLGAKQNESYEDAKEALKLTKSRQAEIVTLLNSQKVNIDSLNAKIAEISVSQEDTIDEQREEAKISLQSQLESAKKAYRVAHNELRLCKEQIAETQSLKKRAMTNLLNAFHDYYDNIPVESTAN